jgi:hypothetical protein
MEKNKDCYGIFKFARTLIEKHLQYEGGKVGVFGLRPDLPSVCGVCDNPVNGLKAKYKIVEREMINFISTAGKAINATDGDGVLRLFRDACIGFSILGLRYDELYKKMDSKKPLSEAAKLSNSIRKDVTGCATRLSPSSLDDIFNSMEGEIVCGLSYDYIDKRVDSAYNGTNVFERDGRALMAVYLLNRLDKISACINLSNLTYLFPDESCVEHIIDPHWANRSLIGHFAHTFAYDFKNEYVRDLNHDFVKIFTGKLDVLFATAAQDDYAAASLREILYSSIVRLYFGYRTRDALRSYHTVNTLIEMAKRGETITEEHTFGPGYLDEVCYSVVLPRQTVSEGLTYELNAPGLLEFVQLVEALKLDDMPCFSSIAEKIRAL